MSDGQNAVPVPAREASRDATGAGDSPPVSPPLPGRVSAFQTLTLAQVRDDLLTLYERIACERGRVEIHDGNGSCACVLISKQELDGLEGALELLGDSDGVRAMRDSLAQFVAGVEPQETPL